MSKQITRKLVYLVVLVIFVMSNFVILTNKAETAVKEADIAKNTALLHIPQGLSVKSLNGSLEINWRKNAEKDGVEKYLIYARTGAERKDENPVEVDKEQNRYILKDLSKNAYYISLAAKDRAGNISKLTPEIGISPNSSGINRFKVAAWMPLIDIEDGKNTLNNNFDLFSSISPFEYSLEPDGSIKRHGEILDKELREKIKNTGKKVIPSITNNFDKGNKGTNVLGDFRKRNKNIEEIILEIKKQNYDGIDIDYENLDPKVRDNFSQFIKTLAKELHKRDKILSVTVQAKQSDEETWTEAYDFEKLGESADQFRIMTYDYARPNTTPGPISPIKWMAKALTYAQSKVDASKIIAGIPFYAYDWCVEGKCDNRGLVWEGVQNIIKKYNVEEVEWDDDAKCPWFFYNDDAGNPHTIYFENAKSIKAKIDLVKKLGISGISIWRLGNEDPEYFKAIKNIEQQVIDKVGNIKVEPLDSAIKLSWDSPIDKELKGYKVLFRKKNSKLRKLNVFGKNEIKISNLENDEAYYLSIVPLTFDDLLNNNLDFEESDDEAQIIATPKDLAYPDTIKNLKVGKVTNTAVNLSWTTSGDDFKEGLASDYDIRFAEFKLNKDNFNQAEQYKLSPEPLLSGAKQEWQIRRLKPGARYYFAVKTLDEAKNASFISNVVFADTIDTIAPKIPAKPVILAGDGRVEISWKANGEKDLAGYKIYYKQEKSFYEFAAVKANVNVALLSNLENNYHYFISISAFDHSGNESAQSEDVETMPKSNKFLGRANDGMNRSAEKLKAASMIFGKRLFSAGAVPYLIMFAIIIINLFIFVGFRKEIRFRVQEVFEQNQKKKIKKPVSRIKSDVIDLRNR